MGESGCLVQNKKRWFRILIVVALIALCFFTLPPKQSVVGGIGGFWGPGKTAYREDYTCIGLNIGLPPLGVTADGGLTYWCFGILTDRVCTIESVTQHSEIIRTPVTCRD